jgi:DNA-binding NarL/FixJ family response regulator
MWYKQNSDSSSDTLGLSERAVLEYCAEGLSNHEIGIRLRMSPREIMAIRHHAAVKLSTRIASDHPFQIREVVLHRSLDPSEL